MQKPLITVIIPTRDRADVLQSSLRTVLTQDYDNLRIIVSDNDSHGATKDVVSGANDNRVRYLNTGRRLSMSANWEFALEHVSEGWVTIIGDDDGLLPGSIKAVAELIQSSDVGALRTSVCNYLWPSLIGGRFGRLSIPLRTGVELRDCRTWLAKVLNGQNNYLELPMLYNGGYVSVATIKAIKAVTGCFYKSCIPDVYSAVAISTVLDRYAYSYEATAINGASQHSTGTSHFSRGGNGSESPAAKFAAEGNLPFHPDVPLSTEGSYPKSLQALVYESYLQSIKLRPADLAPMHDKQLETILATSSKRSEEIQDWGRIFAGRHGLNFESISARSRLSRLKFEAKSALGRVHKALSAWAVTGSDETPILNVQEASVLARQIMNEKPGVLSVSANSIKQGITRLRR
jgi:glycosyltransferase involved in cell wall biosynthesis